MQHECVNELLFMGCLLTSVSCPRTPCVSLDPINFLIMSWLKMVSECLQMSTWHPAFNKVFSHLSPGRSFVTTTRYLLSLGLWTCITYVDDALDCCVTSSTFHHKVYLDGNAVDLLLLWLRRETSLLGT